MGDVFVAGGAWGKVRTLMDHTGKRVQSAGPSTPVQVGGFDGVPDAGDMFTVCDREDVARDLAEARRKIAREANAASLQVGRFEEGNGRGEARRAGGGGHTRE